MKSTVQLIFILAMLLALVIMLPLLAFGYDNLSEIPSEPMEFLQWFYLIQQLQWERG